MKTTIKYLIILIGISVNAQLEQKTTDYSYDNLNRLVQVVFNDGSEKHYLYDDLGNRIQLEINNSTLGIIPEVLRNPIIVYPNPTDNALNISLPKDLELKNVIIELYDVKGRLIPSDKYELRENQISINVNELSNGVYLLHLKSNGKKWSKLFIKK